MEQSHKIEKGIMLKDPVALDYYASKYILLSLGEKHSYHNPDNLNNALHKYLKECNAQGIGTLNERRMIINKFDFNEKSLKEKQVQKALA